MRNIRSIRFWVLTATLAATTVVSLAVVTGAGAATFSSNAPLTINDATSDCTTAGAPNPTPATASPYPSEIAVSGLVGTITDVKVTLTGFTHTFPDDAAALLVGPGNQTAILMQDVGGDADVSGVNLTLDDAALGPLPDNGALVSGAFTPTIGTSTVFGDCTAPSSYPAPAPAGPYGSALSVFNGTDPNGTWSLYVLDDTSADSGSLSGWSLDITVQAPTGDAERAIGDLRDLVASLGLPHGLARSLDSKLGGALTALDANEIASACGSMQTFIDQVKAQTGKKLKAAQAEQLLDAANDIEAQLSC